MKKRRDDYSDIERSLESFLIPVNPTPEFINGLGDRLVNQSSITVEERRSKGKALLIVVFGLYVGLFFLWLLRKNIQ